VAADVPVLYLPVPESIPTTIFDFESTTAIAEESYQQGKIALAGLAEFGPRPGLLGPGLYGRPPLAILNPEIDALRRSLPIPAP